ncbi:hypothetical protein Sste5346_008810 [Sporothrix stenoceras]|uniref:Helicase C-terminal domain-containing protein n=1 Tax=Sporothrix stenoceras TaxID=5173 RepID=A0ABR3YMN2_9PEZI
MSYDPGETIPAKGIPLSDYIPVGSFSFCPHGAGLQGPLRWQYSPQPSQIPAAEGDEHLELLSEGDLRALFHDDHDKFQEAALSQSMHNLFTARWIRFAVKRRPGGYDLENEGGAICRVYVLPDDLHRIEVARRNEKTRRDLRDVLSRLNCTQEQWNGVETDRQLNLDDAQRVVDEDQGSSPAGQSLLQMFNTIPSPSPRTDLINDDSYQRVLDALMSSSIPGLKSTTTLYSHQIRSAAVMLQRELQPGRVVDPRLICLQDMLDQQPSTPGDHEGDRERSEEKRQWYYDDVTGEVLRTARLYDGVSGGILAEEMGTGKTLICLALILATRTFPSEFPDVYVERTYGDTSQQKGPRSLLDMAGRVVSRQSVPWKLYLADTAANAEDFRHCIDAIQRNPAMYAVPKYKRPGRESSRMRTSSTSAEDWSANYGPTITLSSCSLVIVPANLVRQWEEEIAKHTEGLNVIVVSGIRAPVPTTAQILAADILLFSIPRFKKLVQDRKVTRDGYELESPLASVHFKRVIVDEGHHIGNSNMGRKSDLLLVLDCLQISARWIVTGTPSTGLFGVDQAASEASVYEEYTSLSSRQPSPNSAASLQERKDLERIGAMATLYLKVKPWSNAKTPDWQRPMGSGFGDTPADWNVYVMQPHHSNKSSGRRGVLRATLDSLIIRHRTSEVGDLLPTVDERVVVIDGSYQDRLCLNLFSMMIVFNAVQSQRTDQDYFFHPKQRGALLTLLKNIRQATFFGANFYSATEIATALETAEKFLEDKKVPISEDDEALLKSAIAFGHIAVANRFKTLADACHEVPIYVADMPGGGPFAAAWSIDGHSPSGKDGLTCTVAPMVRALQQYLRPCMDAPTSLRAMMDDGRYEHKGHDVLRRQQESVQKQAGRPSNSTTVVNGDTATPATPATPSKNDPTLAGNTKLGEDNHAGSLKKRSTLDTGITVNASSADVFLAAPLANTRLVSTASAKLSYLLDAIVRHQAEEQIIVFYDNENVAFYLAEHLEILQIQHLIYAKGITAERRAQYVATFNGDAKTTESTKSTTTGSDSSTTSPFRVLLMDLSQAAFGLDMRSASRVYFTSPVLNPQVEAQAVGRVRRISQGVAAKGSKKRVLHVETLVLRDSLEEVIVDRRQALSAVEHRRIKTLLDDGPIYEWVRNARVGYIAGDADAVSQMAPLKEPQFLFGRGFGRVVHPDEGLVVVERPGKDKNIDQTSSSASTSANSSANTTAVNTPKATTPTPNVDEHPPKKRKLLPKVTVRFGWVEGKETERQ